MFLHKKLKYAKISLLIKLKYSLRENEYIIFYYQAELCLYKIKYENKCSYCMSVGVVSGSRCVLPHLSGVFSS